MQLNLERRHILTEHCPEEEHIFELLQALNKGISPKFERCAGISPTRLRLLHELFRVDEVSQISLQKEMEIDGAAVTRHLKGLEESGMIARRNNPADNRVTLVSLTDQGRERMVKYSEEKRRFIATLLTGFNDQERAVLIDMLNRLQSNIILL
ncbi:transcriptional regulator [Paenibacillus odorifer]|jgi:DNA-binding MarR family transcriptional regulator|uniref:Transcriptional regulator n=1 Tax=Paenibacillus odorifer TaxID=189426 RepID=A0A1R0WVK3_9BACL|nr:transcriptional regulator [Paenibacillus odorifer]OMD03217.1 transcriptional regulator [Paenibacillus odorifer]OMD07350.1 transcriptional regulator [Paenibacillus odorifer]OMD14551.1 transcriptional regulator [Paenibacillus odorifer]OMD20109.1 transcriptional regulator [Paenibacillus odorifer]